MTDATSNRLIATGTTAERNAFTPSPATPASGPDQGYLWYDTDDQTLYSWDFVTGPGWVAAGGGAGTVTVVSVVTANGVSGTVATDTTTPAITISPDLLNHAACGGI